MVLHCSHSTKGSVLNTWHTTVMSLNNVIVPCMYMWCKGNAGEMIEHPKQVIVFACVAISPSLLSRNNSWILKTNVTASRHRRALLLEVVAETMCLLLSPAIHCSPSELHQRKHHLDLHRLYRRGTLQQAKQVTVQRNSYRPHHCWNRRALRYRTSGTSARLLHRQSRHFALSRMTAKWLNWWWTM